MRKFQYCFFLLLAGTAHAQDFVQSRVPSDREQPEYVMLDTTTRPFWTGKQINWYYNPANQPVFQVFGGYAPGSPYVPYVGPCVPYVGQTPENANPYSYSAIGNAN